MFLLDFKEIFFRYSSAWSWCCFWFTARPKVLGLRLGKEEMLLTIGDNARQRLKCACRPRFQGPLSSSLKGGNKRTLETGLCVCANKTRKLKIQQNYNQAIWFRNYFILCFLGKDTHRNRVFTRLSRALVLRLVERSYRAITSWNRERGGKRTLLHHYYCIASVNCKDVIQIQQVLSN